MTDKEEDEGSENRMFTTFVTVSSPPKNAKTTFILTDYEFIVIYSNFVCECPLYEIKALKLWIVIFFQRSYVFRNISETEQLKIFVWLQFSHKKKMNKLRTHVLDVELLWPIA